MNCPPQFLWVSSHHSKRVRQAGPTLLNYLPAQATHLLLGLVNAKLFSPDYQLPPDEWEKTRYGPMMENLVKYKELKESGQQSKLVTKGALVTFTTPTGDIRTLVSHAISEMSLTDGLDLVDQAFAAVGIGK